MSHLFHYVLATPSHKLWAESEKSGDAVQSLDPLVVMGAVPRDALSITKERCNNRGFTAIYSLNLF